MVLLCLGIECGMVLLNNVFQNIIKYSGMNNIMSGQMNVAMNMALCTMSYGNNSSSKHNNNNSNISISDCAKRREACESIGSKSNNSFAYLHGYDSDLIPKVMKRLSELEKEQNINIDNNSNIIVIIATNNRNNVNRTTTGISILNTIETSCENAVIINNDKNISNSGDSYNNKHGYVMDAIVLHLIYKVISLFG